MRPHDTPPGYICAATFRRRVQPAGGEAEAPEPSAWRREQAEKAAARGASDCSTSSAACCRLAVIARGRPRSSPASRRRRARATSRRAQPSADATCSCRQQIGDLERRAKAAGCKLANPEIEGATHETKNFKASDYKTNPPTSGNHYPDWYEDGIYAAGTRRTSACSSTRSSTADRRPVQAGHAPQTVAQLEALLAEQSDGYHMLLFENTTNMDAQIAATAWGHSLTCPEMNDKVFDAIRTFRTAYIDKGPEKVD